MTCEVCSITGAEDVATETCRTCGAALCVHHAKEAAQHRVGGMRYGCPH